jgi:hypothetical protein
MCSRAFAQKMASPATDRTVKENGGSTVVVRGAQDYSEVSTFCGTLCVCVCVCNQIYEKRTGSSQWWKEIKP